MKKYKSLLIAAFTFSFVLWSFHACKDDKILDVKPGFLAEDSFFQEEAEFERAVRSIYAKLTDFYWYGNGEPIVGIWTLPGDDITTVGDVPLEIFSTINSGDGWLNRFYKANYELINRANVLLEKNQNSKVYVNEANKKAHRGEALFLRSLANFNLWNNFGNPPLVLERASSTDQTTPGNSKENELLNQAIIDLQEAATLLPEKWDNLNRGRATANSARGLLGKVLVFRGTWTKSNADFSAAITAFNAIKGLKLISKFNENFIAAAENNEESLFEFQASQPSFDNVWLSNDFGGTVGSLSAYWGYFENHWSLFGRPAYVSTSKLQNAFEVGDPRKALTLNADGLIVKYVDGDQKSQGGVGSVNNPRILRYADVLLLKAEAILKSGGSTTEAIGLINQIRTRAREMSTIKLIPADYPSSGSATQALEWLRNERFIELAGEGHRWNDLRRWHKAGDIQLNTAFFQAKNSKANFDPAIHIFFPIPNNEIDLNPNVKQNPGY